MKKDLLNYKNNIESILFFAFPLFFLTVKSYSNFILLLITIYSLANVILDYESFFKGRSRKFWLLLIGITFPFTAELSVQVLRTGFQIGALDGPIRFLAAGIIFVYFSKSDYVSKHFHYFSFGCLLSVFFTLIPILFFKEYYWGNRAASYFSDPNTIAVYCVVLLFCSFFCVSKIRSTTLQLVVHGVVLFSTFYIVVYSGTRTAWASLVIVLIFYLISVRHQRCYWLFYFIFFPLLLYITSIINSDIYSIIQQRIVLTIDALMDYASGVSSHSSSGIRLNLILLDIDLIMKNFWLGIPDGTLPPYDALKSSNPKITEIDYHTRLYSGSHVELLAQMSRKGFILGLLTTISLFIIPLLLSILALLRKKHNYMIMCTALLVTFSLFISSFGIQVFPLKMTSSFWGVFMAVFYCNYYKNSDELNQDS